MKFAGITAILSTLTLSSPTSAFTTPAYRRTHIIPAYSTYLKESTLEENNAETTEQPSTPPQADEQPAAPAATISTSSNTITKPTSKITPDRIDKVTKERPYPLFLAEKVFSILPSSSSESNNYPTNNNEKERIIVLGTGWGAAAFLKTIDCNKYDVTVISPRNYFVFTPMLAGASVGTVEFRSITEPVREVSMMFVFILYMKGFFVNIKIVFCALLNTCVFSHQLYILYHLLAYMHTD